MAWFLSPLAWLLVAVVLTGLAWWPRGRAWLLTGAALLAVAAVAAMTPFGANRLVAPLERPLADDAACSLAPPSTAIVLGGGVEGWARSDTDFAALNLSSRRRIDRAVDWWRAQAGRSLVVQGGAPRPGAIPVAALMAAYAQSLGVPPQSMRVETRSMDTWSNAEQAARQSPRLPSRIMLVTSMIHMPRARMAFARAGFQVCALGADSRRLPSRLPWALVPRTSALGNAEDALHEWAGLAYYRWRTRRDAAPASP
ncbi:YdcF family protein [Agrilutibacter solisilvae]|uniref:YdcF family protein n=1 Tax=Agrilutibacter solisilvae TaxID=2763317 RepID=A0A974XZH3_9GAMM|nr:YdcF family protein [Lysobacter solisilvae]QSX77685.1 YdcF family protein [Lysobacter solisilvae]